MGKQDLPNLLTGECTVKQELLTKHNLSPCNLSSQAAKRRNYAPLRAHQLRKEKLAWSYLSGEKYNTLWAVLNWSVTEKQTQDPETENTTLYRSSTAPNNYGVPGVGIVPYGGKDEDHTAREKCERYKTRARRPGTGAGGRTPQQERSGGGSASPRWRAGKQETT